MNGFVGGVVSGYAVGANGFVGGVNVFAGDVSGHTGDVSRLAGGVGRFAVVVNVFAGNMSDAHARLESDGRFRHSVAAQWRLKHRQ